MNAGRVILILFALLLGAAVVKSQDTEILPAVMTYGVAAGGGGGTPGVTNGLIVWMKFDDGSGTTAKDCSNNGRTGFWVGTPGWVSGFCSGAMGASANNYVTNAHDTAFNVGTGDYAVSGWFNTLQDSNNAELFVMNDWGNGGTGIALEDRFDGKFIFSDLGGSFTFNNSPPGLNDGNWHLIVQTRNGTTVTCYVDGSSVGTFSSSASIPSFPTQSVISIGTIPTGAVNKTLVGSIDDIRYFNVGLSAGDVENLYTNSCTACLAP